MNAVPVTATMGELQRWSQQVAPRRLEAPRLNFIFIVNPQDIFSCERDYEHQGSE